MDDWLHTHAQKNTQNHQHMFMVCVRANLNTFKDKLSHENKCCCITHGYNRKSSLIATCFPCKIKEHNADRGNP